jgi:hypothetical protein
MTKALKNANETIELMKETYLDIIKQNKKQSICKNSTLAYFFKVQSSGSHFSSIVDMDRTQHPTFSIRGKIRPQRFYARALSARLSFFLFFSHFVRLC